MKKILVISLLTSIAGHIYGIAQQGQQSTSIMVQQALMIEELILKLKPFQSKKADFVATKSLLDQQTAMLTLHAPNATKEEIAESYAIILRGLFDRFINFAQQTDIKLNKLATGFENRFKTIEKKINRLHEIEE